MYMYISVYTLKTKYTVLSIAIGDIIQNRTHAGTQIIPPQSLEDGNHNMKH